LVPRWPGSNSSASIRLWNPPKIRSDQRSPNLSKLLRQPTSLEVPTLEGPATVKIPPGAQPDEVLRLRGKGLPEFGGGTRGDLYIGLRLQVPERLSAEERELYQRLRALSRGGGK
jgi:DnaJ-class molecular chaperone